MSQEEESVDGVGSSGALEGGRAWNDSAGGEVCAVISFGTGEGLPGSGEEAGNWRVRSAECGIGLVGFEAEAEEEGIGNGADGEDAAGVFADELEDFGERLWITVGFDAAGFEIAEEGGFAGVFPVAAGNEVVVGDGVEVPVVGSELWLMVLSMHATRF